jgi:hypothetical protein
MNRSEFMGKEVSIERQTEFKPYFMGMQVSCGVDTEISKEIAL